MSQRFSGLNARAVALAVVVFILALLLASPAQRYFSQRAQISALQHRLDASRDRVKEARLELEQWRDPDYIKTQARARLHFVMPGETQYIVIDSSEKQSASPTNLNVVADLPAQAAWYQKLVSSVQLVAKVGSTTQ